MKMTWIMMMMACSGALLFGACAPEPEGAQAELGIEGGEPDEHGKATFGATGDVELVVGKADTITGRGGLPVSVDQQDTSVWEVRNQWEETQTLEARAAGMAWEAESGLSWEEKFGRWVESLERTEVHGSTTRQTFTLTTPFGKTLPAPALECAEAAIFLRVAFASWYGLPFFLEAVDAQGRIYFGHFGMLRANGRFANTPSFRTRYDDFSQLAQSVSGGATWPSDSALAAKKIFGSFDDAQPALGPDLHVGAYFDEIFLNKRAGHFLVTTLAFFGSIHLADSRNTFNVKPEGIEGGDVLVKRWQGTGIGHVLLVMRADEAGSVDGQPRFEAEVASGSMPRRQPVWESAGSSKRYFSHEHTGGEGFSALGGGLKRWRIAKEVNGRWTNVVSASSRPDWVSSTDHEAIAARLERFSEILVQLSPEQRRDIWLEVIETKREHLRRFPASCAARIAREDAFGGLYAVMEQEFGVSAQEVDSRYRRLEDYVFAELEYGASKTCCWNSSTANMYEVAMEMNLELQQQGEMCADVVVFMNRDDAGDGYEVFREWADQNGRAGQWVSWRADESCPQSGVPEDTFAARTTTPYCSLDLADVPTPVEPTQDIYTLVDGDVSIPDNDAEGVRFTVDVDASGRLSEVAVDISITHTYRGDLEVELVHPSGASAIIQKTSWTAEDNLVALLPAAQFEGMERAGTWTLIVRDMMSVDTGKVNAARLVLR